MSKIYDIGIADIQRIGFLTSPGVGNAEAIKAAAVARQRFNDAGIDVVSIQAKDDAATIDLVNEMVRSDSIDALVVCGDDPLINLALQPQAESEKPLGLIPAGEHSDLGRSLNIPINPKRAADIVMRGFFTTTDLGRVANNANETRWFATIACSGFDARVTQRSKYFGGRLRALRAPLGAVASIFDFHSAPCTITLDGDLVITEDILLCAIGNTQYYGQGMMMCPEANHHDGLFDISLVPDFNERELLSSFWKLYQRKPDKLDFMTTYRAKSIVIEHENQPNAADCRPFSDGYLKAEVVEGAGRFLVPRP